MSEAEQHDRGLTETQARSRLKEEGHNELPEPLRRTPLRIVREVLREPMLALLLAGGLVYLMLGDLQDALVLLGFAALSMVITVIQETRTERVLEALRDLTSPRALVIRDGQRKRIAGRDVVRGDLVVLGEGDRVPADARLAESRDMQVDESLLTGESVPVRKVAANDTAAPRGQRPGGDDLPFVFAGSLVVRGSGVGEVTAIGRNSEIGKIGQSLGSLETESPRLNVQARRLVRVFAAIGAAISLIAILLYGFLRARWLDGLLAGIALGMTMLPAEIPVVLTVFMAMGAWRISRARVLTRRAAAIETLGSATVLCADKTGTLTQNRMSVVALAHIDGTTFRTHDSARTLPPQFRALVEFAVLGGAEHPIDPMERAIDAFAQRYLDAAEPARRRGWRLARAYGLRPDLLAMSHAWRTQSEDIEHVIATKGAPESVADLCRLGTAERDALRRAVDFLAADGIRVLGVARAKLASPTLPESQRDFALEFLGLVGLADPLRPSVPAAIDECRSAGIKVLMITGDYPATARAIAREAGLDAGDVVTGEQLDDLSDDDLARRLRGATVFARIMPQQKLRIVEALKSNGEVVAMTGDGVNDAPSLKAAHIGIAMGGRGTDVAREASSIVLLDDDFGSIVASVRLGRRIYDNVRKAMAFIFAVHVPIAGLALLPLSFGLPILLGPVHIAFLQLVIDPVCSLVFEAETEESDVMRRPPRAPDAPLFSVPLVSWGLLQGAFAFALVAAIFVMAHARGMPEDEVRALTFFALVLTIVAVIFVNRSFSASPLAALLRPNATLLAVLFIVVAMLSLTLSWPLVSGVFRFGPLHPNDLGVTLGAGVLVLVSLELLKPLWRERL